MKTWPVARRFPAIDRARQPAFETSPPTEPSTCIELQVSVSWPELTDITQMTSRFAEIIPRTTVEGTVFPLQPSDGLILEISPRLEGHLARFAAIQTHPSCRFHLAVALST